MADSPGLSVADFRGYYKVSTLPKSQEAPGSYDSTITDFEAETAAAAIIEGGLEETLSRSDAVWLHLQKCLDARPPAGDPRDEFQHAFTTTRELA